MNKINKIDKKFKKIELQEYYFDEENIDTLTLEKVLDIMETKFYSFSFYLSFEKIKSHLKKIGFLYESDVFKYKNDYISIEIEFDFLIEYSKYCILELSFTSKIKEKTIIFQNSILHTILEDIKVEEELIERKSIYKYENLTINGNEIINLNSIVYYYDDNRDKELDLFLFSIIEIPFKINELDTTFCIFDLVFVDEKSNVHKMSEILEMGFNKLDTLFNIKSTDRFKFNRISSILNEEDMNILKLIKY